MKRIVLVLILCAAATPAWAGWDEAVTATEHGDNRAAVQKFRPLAQRGEARAQAALGAAYHEGRSVPLNYVLSHMWPNLAASRLAPGEDRNAVSAFRDFVESQMAPHQVAEAQRLARQWMPKADIEKLQFYLYLYGHPPGPIDGVAGAKTRSAIRAFEREQGLPETGEPTRELADLVFRRVVEYLTASE